MLVKQVGRHHLSDTTVLCPRSSMTQRHMQMSIQSHWPGCRCKCGEGAAVLVTVSSVSQAETRLYNYKFKTSRIVSFVYFTQFCCNEQPAFAFQLYFF